ncbi:hypothetical protein EVAR_102741_1 [Eumeta japonica]|uniref:Uncharacterized protein n=1 Tax=Eumeta variegata TaxID=151549 RepID=A0A4C1TL70_EUMVA|nr:hypothetical protein EVAR_102741_1 [Eumeta japonica]
MGGQQARGGRRPRGAPRRPPPLTLAYRNRFRPAGMDESEVGRWHFAGQPWRSSRLSCVSVGARNLKHIDRWRNLRIRVRAGQRYDRRRMAEFTS